MAYKAVNDALDMNNNDLIVLVRACLQNGGKLFNNRQKQLIEKGHPAALFQKAQQVVTSELEGLDGGRWQSAYSVS